MSPPETLHLFCRVVDNLGDVGVCWRLARQLASEHGLAVTLWVDDLPALKRICPPVDATRADQSVSGVRVRRWPRPGEAFAPDETADLVIEAFACEPPQAYVAAMSKRTMPPAWINLEYLSAEDWVEGSHRLPSPHPSLPLVKHFFFPGFTGRTGGLILESGLIERRDAFQADPSAGRGFLASLGFDAPEDALAVSLFCYPNAPVPALFEAMARNERPVLCLVPEGVASEPVATFLGRPGVPGAFAAQGSLTVHVLPFVPQEDYDRLLWACDLNFVRGEDSFVRAQWAARPFVWQIYPQDERAHETKLDAFLARYLNMLESEASSAVRDLWLAWNETNHPAGHDLKSGWQRFVAAMPRLARFGPEWSRHLANKGDLAGNLLGFVRALR